MKSLLMILTEFPPSIGGMQTHALHIAKYFASKNIHIEVYTYKSTQNLAECLDFNRDLPFKVYRKLSRISYYANISLLKKEIKRFLPDAIYSSTIFYGILEELTKIPTICRSVGNDLTRPWIIYPYKLGAKILSTKFFEYLFHHLIYKRVGRPSFIEIFLANKRKKLAINAAQKASQVLANSTFTYQLLKGVGVQDKKLKIVVGGVDSSYFKKPLHLDAQALREQLNLPLHKTLLLTVCRLVEKKGIDTLLVAMADLIKDHPHLRLLIIGDGPKKKAFERMAFEKLNLQNHVSFVGKIDHQEIRSYYWVADLFILSSKVCVNKITGFQDAETMGRVLCEANAASIPIVAAHSGGIPSIIQDQVNGLLFEEGNVEDLQLKLRHLLKKSSLQKQFVANGLALAKNTFDWQNIFQQHEEVFKNISY